MVVCIAPHLEKDKDFFYTRRVVDVLNSTGQTCIVPDDCGGDLPGFVRRLPIEDAVGSADAVLTIGGDGTMLHMARRLGGTGKLLLGLNLGRMGFLTALEPDEISRLSCLASGNYIVEERSLLSVSVNGAVVDLALNEAVVSSAAPAAQTMDFSLACDCVFVDAYRGDGIIFATATGSTAYSLSAGGPVLDSALSACVVTPVCAHRLASPSLVFDGGRTLCLTVAPDNRDEAVLTVDGRAALTLSAGDRVEITRAAQTVRLVYFGAVHQFTSIDKKLR